MFSPAYPFSWKRPKDRALRLPPRVTPAEVRMHLFQESNNADDNEYSLLGQG
jgi:hypothetical protein